MKIFSIRNAAVYVTLCICLMLNASLASAGVAQARDFIQKIGDQVIGIVSDETLAADKKEQKLNELFARTVDINWIAKFVVGKYWRESTPVQQKQYLGLYTKFLMESYVSKFRQYTDQKLLISKFVSIATGEYLVETTIDDQDGKSYKVNYKLRETQDGGFKIYDIIAEGVSLITTQRSEFGSILDREGMDSLIAQLQKKE